MLCQFCKTRTATIHFTNVDGGDVQKIHICRQCAEEKGFEYLKKSNFEKHDLIAGLMDDPAAPPRSGHRTANRCPTCGRTYAAFSKSASLGCSKCYECFGADIAKVLKRIHGNARHLGKVPRRFCTDGATTRRRLKELRSTLRAAVESENYERAAELRDEIESLRRSLADGKGS
ncbi:MAG: UvrB/UvrC motif-containing protein [Candidatus Krumholzibacteria bacterium]|nr:UvrB/UvrC motif-containing protein [Candidatus Krumholzibacteria bacterium]